MRKLKWIGPVTDLGPFQAKPGRYYELTPEQVRKYSKLGWIAVPERKASPRSIEEKDGDS